MDAPVYAAIITLFCDILILLTRTRTKSMQGERATCVHLQRNRNKTSKPSQFPFLYKCRRPLPFSAPPNTSLAIGPLGERKWSHGDAEECGLHARRPYSRAETKKATKRNRPACFSLSENARLIRLGALVH